MTDIYEKMYLYCHLIFLARYISGSGSKCFRVAVQICQIARAWHG